MSDSDKSLSVYHFNSVKQTGRAVIFDCPHAGRVYPADFATTCPTHQLERAEDRFMDKMLDWAQGSDIPLLVADFPRTYIDVNRAVNELDPLMLAENWPEDISETEMTRAGIGLIRRMLTPTMPIGNQPLTIAQTTHRIEQYYIPYHAALIAMVHESWQRHGHVLHLNWHSMPSRFATGQRMPDFVLGNRFGHSADNGFLTAGADYLRSHGFSVRLNDPYPGQEILRRVGAPQRGIHSVQVEVNKALYLDENRNMLNAGHHKLRGVLQGLTHVLEDHLHLLATPLAAD